MTQTQTPKPAEDPRPVKIDEMREGEHGVAGHAGPSTAAQPSLATRPTSLAARFTEVRRQTERLIAPLSSEDACVQSMPDTSPAKWHLGHTTWFFETLILRETSSPKGLPYRPFAEEFGFIFNSYYNGIGPQYSRPERGLLTRPSLSQVLEYREYVDSHVDALFERGPFERFADHIEIGLHHEMQHQELLLMDIKHLFSCNPLDPTYRRGASAAVAHSAPALAYIAHPGGIQSIGADSDGFAFDNERPRHQIITRDFALANRPVTNAEYLAFIADGGYETPLLWLSDGFAAIREHGLAAPLYWRPVGAVPGAATSPSTELADADAWTEFTLGGRQPLDPNAPVAHLSFYEADAFARWAGARLPTEAEWEQAAAQHAVTGNFMEQGELQPRGAAAPSSSALMQIYGDVWEWTSSPYVGYPGFKPTSGALAEYNGKFMSNQMVLRGGACLTPQAQLRSSYRNFFYPHTRWQCSGLRLAKDG